MSDASAPAAVPAHLTYELRLEVDASHLDGQGHVNNVVYVHWVQDVAIAHWEALTTPAQRSATGWVALRHEIDYLHPARLGDAVVVRTRIGALEKLTFERTCWPSPRRRGGCRRTSGRCSRRGPAGALRGAVRGSWLDWRGARVRRILSATCGARLAYGSGER